MSTFREAIRRVEIEIRDRVLNRPDLSYKMIGLEFEISEDMVIKICKKFGISRPWGRKCKTQKVS